MVLKFEPWGDDPVFDWDEENEPKIWEHGISVFDVEECFDNPHTAVPHEKAKSQPEKYGDRYVVRGVTDGGRKLVIIVQYLFGNWVRPITAWDDR
ncbi:MAG: BrnT family toxin [Candidatus Omnitrophica bacterium]|nr:BrnT family toxin [Candidatus Omnitrophota bacterium]